MAQTQTWETKTNWAMEKLIPKELAKNNKQTINNPRMENKSEDTPRTKISRFKQSFKASQRILKSKPILEKVESNHKISKTYTTRQNAIETIFISKKMASNPWKLNKKKPRMEPILQNEEKVWRNPKKLRHHVPNNHPKSFSKTVRSKMKTNNKVWRDILHQETRQTQQNKENAIGTILTKLHSKKMATKTNQYQNSKQQILKKKLKAQITQPTRKTMVPK